MQFLDEEELRVAAVTHVEELVLGFGE